MNNCATNKHRVSLKALEKAHCRSAKIKGKSISITSAKQSLLLGILLGPFSVFGALFIPLIGILLAISAYLLTLLLFWQQRKLTHCLVFFAGCFLSIALIGAVGRYIVQNFSVAFYFIIATAIAVLIIYNFLISALILKHIHLAESKI
jgi:hypothetical protein